LVISVLIIMSFLSSANRRRWALLYNDKCPLCRGLANRIYNMADRQVRLVPLGDEPATSLLRKFYSSDPPKSYFLVEENRNGAKVHNGWRAALQLPRVVGFRHSFELLALYLVARARSARSPNHQSDHRGSGHVPDRRRFLGLVARGAVIVGFGSLAGLSLGTASAGCDWPRYNSCLDGCNASYWSCVGGCVDNRCQEDCVAMRNLCYSDCCRYCTGSCPQ
jgi:predicted DCC family thiol-disulfide oxidoreductase YuxK